MISVLLVLVESSALDLYFLLMVYKIVAMKHPQHFVFQGNEYYLKFALEIQIGFILAKMIHIYLSHI